MTRFREDFVACRDCQALHPVAVDPPMYDDEVTQDAVDAQRQFIAQHTAHRLTALRRHGIESRADRPLWDPLATIIFEVTDGQRIYVATGMRRSIDEPRLYRFTPGSLELRSTEITIDGDDLRRGLDLQFYPHAIRPSKVDRFIAALDDLLHHVAADELEIAFDAAEDPAVSVARMPDAVYDELLTRCSDIFDAWEVERVRPFLRENRDDDGLLTLRVRREFDVLHA